MNRPATRPAHRSPLALHTAFRRFFWLSYDSIGLVLLANLLWLVLSLGVVTAPAATAGLATLTARIARGEHASLRDLLRGFREHFFPALKLGLFDAAVVLVLWVNVDFYSHLGGKVAIPGFLLAGLLVWGAAFWLLIHVHIYPLLVDGERSLRKLLRTAALLTLDNLAFTIGTALQTTMLTILCVLSGVGLFVVLTALMSLLHAASHRELLRRYRDDIEPDEPETRTWRHIWRPWEGPGAP